MTDVIATVSGGAVRGVREGGVSRFLAIPYAAPPVGENRFAAPQPVTPWEGVRDATQPGPNAPQAGGSLPNLDLSPLVGSGWVKGDDYLTVNVWTPDCEARGLPVMIWIHGGGFVGGVALCSANDGTAFARSGVVLISITYRLGIEGFLPMDGAPTNLGLRDQIAAIAWVKANAAAFGGDPANITIFGESAGAMSVGDLVGSPLAQGLFQKAIIESGHGSMVRSITVTKRLTAKIARQAGITADRAGFATLSLEDAIKAMTAAQSPKFRVDLTDERGRNPAYGLSRFLPVYGDDVLPEPPLQALAKGVGKDIQVLIGANAEEMNLYFVPTGVKDKINSLLAWFMVSRSIKKAWAILKAYGLGQKGRKAGDVMTQAMTDLVFRYPTRLFAAAHQGRTHLYDFAWRSTACDGQLGACHAVEIPFVFNTLASATGPKGVVGEAPPQALADSVHKVCVDFAKSGELPWPEYELATRQVYALADGIYGTDADMPAAKFV